MRVEELPSNIFISGTDTGIGKTVISAMMTLGLSAIYWKPVQSGLEEETDTEFVQRITGLPGAHFKPERYRLQEPLSPHASAAIDGVSISLNDFQLPETGDNNLVVEGAGGLLVPLNDEDMIIDLISRFRLPVLLVVRSELGTLNHTFLSLEALRNRSIPLLGVIMNGPKNKSNKKAIEKYGKIEVLGEIETLRTLNPQTLMNEFNKIFKP